MSVAYIVHDLILRTALESYIMQIGIHLDRIAGASPEPPNRNYDNHWWREIKAFMKGIAKQIKRKSEEQIARAIDKMKMSKKEVAKIIRKALENPEVVDCIGHEAATKLLNALARLGV